VPDIAAKIERAFREHVLALVNADAGELYLVRATGADVHVHLAGTCSGCPGAYLTEQALIGPVVFEIAPKAALVVTTGFRIPEGAKRIAL
jgi:Fe-S cluster biogenesis protein NfuA